MQSFEFIPRGKLPMKQVECAPNDLLNQHALTEAVVCCPVNLFPDDISTPLRSPVTCVETNGVSPGKTQLERQSPGGTALPIATRWARIAGRRGAHSSVETP